jgi:hypothetical protein
MLFSVLGDYTRTIKLTMLSDENITLNETIGQTEKQLIYKIYFPNIFIDPTDSRIGQRTKQNGFYLIADSRISNDTWLKYIRMHITHILIQKYKENVHPHPTNNTETNISSDMDNVNVK